MIEVAAQVVVEERSSQGHMGLRKHFTVYVEAGDRRVYMVDGPGYRSSTHENQMIAVQHASEVAAFFGLEVVSRRNGQDTVLPTTGAADG